MVTSCLSCLPHLPLDLSHLSKLTYSYLLYKTTVSFASLWVKGHEEKPTIGGGADMRDLGKVMMILPSVCLLGPLLPL